MDEYIPEYLKSSDKVICNKCTNKLSIDSILSFTYLRECEKCTNLGDYDTKKSRDFYNQICKCSYEKVYKKIYKCMNCSKCKKCRNELLYGELNKLKNINQENICDTCKNFK